VANRLRLPPLGYGVAPECQASLLVNKINFFQFRIHLETDLGVGSSFIGGGQLYSARWLTLIRYCSLFCARHFR
jgi:hypothetical protein